MSLNDLNINAKENNLTIDVIIINFVIIIKFNSLLITDSLFNNDQINFDKRIITTKRGFIKLNEATTLTTMIITFKKRSVTPKSSVESDINRVNISISVAATIIISKKIEKYRSDQGRLNIHIEVHYLNHFKKYDLINNYNVLIDENKHK